MLLTAARLYWAGAPITWPFTSVTVTVAVGAGAFFPVPFALRVSAARAASATRASGCAWTG